MSEPIEINSSEVAVKFLDQFDNFLFDCDGVLWLGTHLLPHTVEFLDLLKALGKKVYYVTNNSTKSRKDYTKKFASFGINVEEEQIFTSGSASALYVRDSLKLVPGKDKVWVFGESGIGAELNKLGYEALGGADPLLNEPSTRLSRPCQWTGSCCACRRCGARHEGQLPQTRGHAAVLATRGHRFVCWDQRGLHFPPKGAHLARCRVDDRVPCLFLGRRPAYCGKPNMNMLNTIVNSQRLDKTRTCMVGDRLNTDVRFGVEGGLAGTLLVLSGIETAERALAVTEEYPRPHYYAAKLGDIYEMYQKSKKA
ncbi:4-nitrophenylphosphatase KNAG_0E02900 [Huiozyma naganishii CBS 8797]|uniref:4-nitrophenylphosphatase n=1 Tax=Huiozyma naganishii (strain ATCC MYA-139 / BCRC 22969 / CBS 8797 / KCTC 17520 / NBRC 10181 / NCYC 3082 / Yp74L-3) TaxID=1071383 RepID=J7S6S9_HUIN7|nr:hypothetical protein KNAG_0E02900 [Kazachstania naganishii CBS 8797]CCK70549.1 hypothetical protein KNAG_0E02900 [Kazachstania naganishii CBS 8797]